MWTSTAATQQQSCLRSVYWGHCTSIFRHADLQCLPKELYSFLQCPCLQTTMPEGHTVLEGCHNVVASHPV